MLIHKVKLPRLSVATEVVMIVEWKCSVGDIVAAGDPIVTVETDKVTTDVVAPVAGTVVELSVVPEQEVEIGQTLCSIQSP